MQELQRQREEARLQGQKAVLARDKALRELKAEQQRQQQEQNVQAKLRKLSVCVAGFRGRFTFCVECPTWIVNYETKNRFY